MTEPAAGADVVVVGGGVYGLGVAWELARKGARVLVLEAMAEVASGASGGHGTRGVRTNGRADVELPIMRLAIQRWPELATELEDPAIFRAIGCLEFVETPEGRGHVEARALAQSQAGLPTRVVEGDELRQLEPNLSPAISAAMYCEGDGVSDHTATTRALAREAKRHGTVIRCGVRVAGLEVASGRVTSLITKEAERIAVREQLVLAANAGSADLVQGAFGVSLPLFNVLPQALISVPLREPVTTHLVGHMNRRFHMKMLADGRAMISGGFLGSVNAETGLGEPAAWAIEKNLEEAAHVYPLLDGVQIEHAFADRFESVARDGLAILDRVPGATNALLLAGFSGHGWAPAPAYVKLVADWLLSRKRPEELAPFAYTRFV